MSELPNFDSDWQDEATKNIADYLLFLENDVPIPRVLAVRNAEIRRLLLKRFSGAFDEAIETIIDTWKQDRLLKLKSGEHCLHLQDTSTNRKYVLFVPNHLKSCKGAIAWTFNMRKEEYAPLIET